MKQKLIVMTGATAVGKTSAAIEIARHINGEIIGCDAMQIYRGMDIGTGKVTSEEQQGIPHHMIDVISPADEYSVGQYKADAEQCIAEVAARNRVPILVGGTGLYIRAILSGLNFGQTEKNAGLRERLRAYATEHGAISLYRYLETVDAVSAQTIHPNDLKRIIRALEIYITTGIPKSQIADSLGDEPYAYKIYVMQYVDRALLYNRINQRVEKMFTDGLLDEVRRLYPHKDCQSMQAIGYKETVAYWDGLCTAKEALDLVCQNSRRYAKRQMTYFRGMSYDKTWIDPLTVPLADWIYDIERFLSE